MADYDEYEIDPGVARALKERIEPLVAAAQAKADANETAIANLTARLENLHPPVPAPPMLAPSGPIVVTQDGQVIEDLHISANAGHAITCQGFSDVIVRRCKIDHNGGHGIFAQSADRLRVEDVDIVCTGAPPAGANPSDMRGISVEASDGVTAHRIRGRDVSTVIYVATSSNVLLQLIEGQNMRGPLPRGQLVQLNQCRGDNLVLKDFSVTNDPEICWNEDGINIFKTSNVTIKRGLIDGSNGPSGTGVTIEHRDGTNTALIEDVDCVNMSNGCFGPYPGHNVTFRRCNGRDNFCGSRQDRGLPSSGGLIWIVHPTSTGIEIHDSKWFNKCGSLIWDGGTPAPFDVVEEDFVPRAPIRLTFPWEA